MLHNFGGNIGLYGRMSYLNRAIIEARKAPGSTVAGLALTMEGINQNYFIYEFAAEFVWRNEPVDPVAWTKHFVERRYGTNDSLFPPYLPFAKHGPNLFPFLSSSRWGLANFSHNRF